MADIQYEGYIGRTVQDTDLKPVLPNTPPEKKPNVVYIVFDDLGFSQLGCYGSTIQTPNIDRLAGEGLRYNNFHTTAICSATRASLLTGANHHAVGINALVETTSVPGSQNSLGHIDNAYATTAEILKKNGYATFAVGKWHLASMDARTQSGPFDQWPLGRGFDRYYGFLHGLMDHYNPELIRDNSHVYQDKSAADGYHLTVDLTDNAIDYVSAQVNAYPDQPFFLYFALGAMHSPHHVPKEYIDKYKNKFDAGWDETRKEWFDNQKRLGVIPQEAELSPRNELAPAWDTLSDDQKKLYARYMETFAGFLTHTDEQVGRLIDYLRDIGELDNTIITFISDNGASAEGGQHGRFNEGATMGLYGTDSDLETGLKNIDLLGTEFAHNHYPLGWANAGNTPFPWYKVFVHSGGVKDPLIIRYPKAITDKGEVRNQYLHVSDITPTILDVLEIEKPAFVKGIAQKPFTGLSFKHTFTDGSAKTKKRVQYYEIAGNRAIWKDGWKAVVNHTFSESYDDDVWELYNTDEDYSEVHDIADKYPEKLKELQEEWLIEAARNDVFPLLPGNSVHVPKKFSILTRILPEQRKTFRLIERPFDIPFGMLLFGPHHVITAEIDRKGDGVIVASGDRHGGFSLYIKDGKLKYASNDGERGIYSAESSESVPLGKSVVKVILVRTSFTSAMATLFINDKAQANVAIPKALTIILSGNSTIGANKYSAVTDDYAAPFPFDGKIISLNVHTSASSVRTEDELMKFLAED